MVAGKSKNASKSKNESKSKNRFKIKVVNMVANANLYCNDLELMDLAISLEDSTYEPEQFPALIYKPEDVKNLKPSFLIFKSGKIIIAAAKSKEDVYMAVDHVIKKLEELGIKMRRKPDVKINNVVASADLGSKIDVDMTALMLPNVEYEPEVFPGLVWKLPDINATFLMFNSGKIICAGLREASMLEGAISRLYDNLKDAGVLK